MVGISFRQRGAQLLRHGGGFACIAVWSVGCANGAVSRAHHPEPSGAAQRAAPAQGEGRSRDSGPAQGPHALSGAVLERAEFVRAVLHNNPSIEAAQQSRQAAAGRVRQAGAWDDPMVGLAFAPLSIGSSNVPFGYEVEVSQRLPWFGKRALEEAMVSAEVEVAQSDYEQVRRDLALAAVMLYDQYFVTARSLEINARYIELIRSMQASATAALEAGRGSAREPLQAEAELAHMEHDAVKLRSQRDITVAQMNELLHRAPESRLPPPPAELARPDAKPAPSSQKLAGEAVANDTQVRAAHDQARAERARAERAERDAYPDFTLSAAYNSMWDMPEHRFMLGLEFNLPLPGARRGGMADEANAHRAKLESDAARLTDAARSRVFVAAKQLEESKHVLELFERRLLPIARDQIEAARAGFTTSRIELASLLEAERNLRATELEYQMARAEYDGRKASLEHALGRVPGLAQEDDR